MSITFSTENGFTKLKDREILLFENSVILIPSRQHKECLRIKYKYMQMSGEVLTIFVDAKQIEEAKNRIPDIFV